MNLTNLTKQFAYPVVVLLFAGVCLVSAPSMAADTAGAVDIDGLRLGMSKAEAFATLRKSHPKDTPEELYGGFVEMHGFVKVPKKNLGAHDVDIFTALSIQNPRDDYRFGCSSMDSKPSTHERIEVLFTADPSDPRVVLISKDEVYCGNKHPGVREEVGALRSRYGAQVSSSENVDLQFNRFNGEASYRGAFLEWRTGATGPVMQSMGTSPQYNISGLPSDIGNPGGGTVVHAILRPHPADINSLSETQRFLWDDDQMAHWINDHNAVRVRMNQSDWGFGDLGNPTVVQALADAYRASVSNRKQPKTASAAAPSRPVPATPKLSEPIPENPALKGRAPDAEVRIEKQPNLGVTISASSEASVPVGTTVLDPAPNQLFNFGKVTYTSPSKLMFFEFTNCNAPVAGQTAPLTMKFPLCAKLIPVPEDALGEPQALPNLPPGEERKRYRIIREFKVPYQKALGSIGPGTKLYRVDPPVPNANDWGYHFRDGDAYTWFLVDPAGCVAPDGKVFDCSSPVALFDHQWHALK